MQEFVIIYNGKINFINAIKNNINFNDVIKFLKKKKINEIENVEILISIYNKVFFVKEKIRPINLVVDGKILYLNLFKLKKSLFWFNGILRKNNTNLSNVLYAVSLNKRLYIIKK